LKQSIVKIYLLYLTCQDKKRTFVHFLFLFLINIISRFIDGVKNKPSSLSKYLNKHNILFKSYTQWKLFFDDAIEVKTLSKKILFSIIIPVYNPDITYFKECINSVIEQSYPNWELCIADDFSPLESPHFDFINTLNTANKIKFLRRENNGHISACTNSAISLASGQFILLLDQDDKLHKHCLSSFAEVLNSYQELDFVYADEDLLTGSTRHSPAFKPAFSPHNLISRNYITHPVIIRTELVKEMGGMREGYEGSQDHDLFLRITAKTNKVFHIPKILYHWRVHSKSTSTNITVKPYIQEASQKAIADHLTNCAISVESVSSKHPNYYRIFSNNDLCPDLEIIKIKHDWVLTESFIDSKAAKFIDTIQTKKYLLLISEELETPGSAMLNEALTILEHTNADSVGGVIIENKKALPNAYFLQKNHLETFYSYKKYPYIGYHGFGLSFSNVDALNPNFWFLRTELFKETIRFTDPKLTFYQIALAIFGKSIEKKQGLHVFAPQIYTQGNDISKARAEMVYNLFKNRRFKCASSNYLSFNINLTKRSFYFK